MTPVEAVARAIIQRGIPDRDYRINPICAEELALAIPLAKAALEALREPSEGMLMAADDLPIYDGEGHNLRDVWTAMIDAAIEEGVG